ncbi:MAG: hypothetical protein U0176_04425 [Bacteroidia bacterium]
MRKSLVLACLMLLLTWQVAHSQTPEQRFRFGGSLGFEGTTFINNPFNTLISKIYIPGVYSSLHARMRIGRHFSLRVSPGYTYRPYRSHRTFIGDGVDENGNPDPLNGKLIDRKIRGDLHELRLAIGFQYHFKDVTHGWHISIAPELQKISLREFNMSMSMDSTEFFHAQSDLYHLPFLLGGELSGGYTTPVRTNLFLSLTPYIKYGPLFVKDAKVLSWGTVGFCATIWR